MLKINPKLSVRPKVFWLSIIILLMAGAFFYIVKERMLRVYTQEQLARVADRSKEVESRLIKSIKAKRIAQEGLAIEKEKSFTLGKELNFALDKLEKEMIARREAETQLIITMKEKRILEATVKEFAQAPRTIQLEKIVVKPAPLLTGNVLVVNREFAFVIVDLGRVNNVNLGDVLSVYRGGEFVGKVQVEKVEEKISAATVLPEWQTIEFRENDEVKKI